MELRGCRSQFHKERSALKEYGGAEGRATFSVSQFPKGLPDALEARAGGCWKPYASWLDNFVAQAAGGQVTATDHIHLIRGVATTHYAFDREPASRYASAS